MTQSTVTNSVGQLADLLRRLSSKLWICELKLKGATIEGRLMLAGRPLVSIAPRSEFFLGDMVELSSSTRSTLLGAFQPCVLRTLTAGAQLRIGRNVGLSGTVICAGRRIEVGEGTIFGSG